MSIRSRTLTELMRAASCAVLLAAAGSDAAASNTGATPLLVTNFVADIMRANNAEGRAFAVIDKPQGMLWVFNAQGLLLDQSPVLVGQARGDVAPADIGTRALRNIRPHEKITASGRYVTEPGRNHKGEDIVWLDYDAAMSMHRVRNVPGENRLKRLASADLADNRISYGCVNVPVAFYERHIAPLFARKAGVVYVLPETKSVSAIFPFATEAHRRNTIR